MKIIGRIEEINLLEKCMASDRPEFIALYGRRRVGKTYLIREFFNDDFAFTLTGVANGSKSKQLDYFNRAMQAYGYKGQPVRNWDDAFEELKLLLEKRKTKSKKVIFFDELPWIATSRSGFLEALEHFWNAWACSRPEIILIVCGSAASWITRKVLRNRKGLHNRVTRRIELMPFTLAECEQYFQEFRFGISRLSVVDAYMAFGGIPYYLSLMENDLSVAQNIDALCFSSQAQLRNEFDELYASLFAEPLSYISVIRALAKKKSGLSRNEIVAETGITSGGGLTKILDDLELSGFIRSYEDYTGTKARCNYQLVDFFSLFYLAHIDGKKPSRIDSNYWQHTLNTPRINAWSGYAFEQVCLAHVNQIKNKLGISGIAVEVFSWRGSNGGKNTQIDLILDRADGIINLCEAKYVKEPLLVSKALHESMLSKQSVFRAATKTQKGIHQVLISSGGFMPSQYLQEIHAQITLDDLF